MSDLTERVNHVAKAMDHMAGWDSEGHFAGDAAFAQVHATLALVEQQRIANVIALAQIASDPDAIVTPAERAAWEAIAHPGTGHPRPWIKEALGL